jgi:hypothetical protein
MSKEIGASPIDGIGRSTMGRGGNTKPSGVDCPESGIAARVHRSSGFRARDRASQRARGRGPCATLAGASGCSRLLVLHSACARFWLMISKIPCVSSTISRLWSSTSGTVWRCSCATWWRRDWTCRQKRSTSSPSSTRWSIGIIHPSRSLAPLCGR